MDLMKQESLLRLAISLDNQAPTTLDKYICKLVESVLCESSINALSAIELCTKIYEVYGLEFDVEEVIRAIKHRGKSSILTISGKYSLNPKKRTTLEDISDVNVLLEKHIRNYKEATKVECDESALSELLRKYLYHCLNSNITNLMSLLNQQYLDGLDSFLASNEEISAINSFINWENEDKNHFLYTIVSFSYSYCMLTVKKDSLLSSRIFKGKKFFLDTNLIFRMAGINKDERKFVIDSFISKCKSVGIELYYTNETLAELHRVIKAQISYVMHLTQGQEPIDLDVMEKCNSDKEINDFYEIYDKWCKEPQNIYNDFQSFNQYLLDLIHNVIINLNYVEIPNYGLEKNNEGFQRKCYSLMQYKTSERRRKSITKESVRADINNVIYTLMLRNGTKGQNLWQINEFFVSADQLLMEWAKIELTGVPIVVIPSVWLSIILRFTGRTSDDYKTFCLFLNLRHHRMDDDNENAHIKPSILLPILAQKTNDKEIKQKIILEIMRNCEQYQLQTKEDHEQAVEKAFDKYLSELKTENAHQLALEAQRFNEKLALKDQAVELSIQNAKEETIIKISRKKASGKVEFWENILFIRYVLWVFCTIFWLGSILIFLMNGKFIIPLPQIFLDNNLEWDFIKWFGVAIGFILCGIGELINYLSSEKREKILFRKYYENNKREFQ